MNNLTQYEYNANLTPLELLKVFYARQERSRAIDAAIEHVQSMISSISIQDKESLIKAPYYHKYSRDSYQRKFLDAIEFGVSWNYAELLFSIPHCSKAEDLEPYVSTKYKPRGVDFEHIAIYLEVFQKELCKSLFYTLGFRSFIKDVENIGIYESSRPEFAEKLRVPTSVRELFDNIDALRNTRKCCVLLRN